MIFLPTAMKRAFLFAVFLLVLTGAWSFQTESALAANKYWIGPSGGNVSDNTNWSLSSGGSNDTTAPGASDVAIFDSGDTDDAIVDTSLTVSAMTLLSGYGGTVSLADTLGVTGDLMLSSGTTLAADGNDISAGAFSNASGAVLSLYGSETLTMTMDTNSGEVLFNGSGVFSTLPFDTYNDLTFNNAGGDYTIDAPLVVNGDFSVINGSLDLGGQTVSIDESFDKRSAATLSTNLSEITFVGSSAGKTINMESGSLYDVVIARGTNRGIDMNQALVIDNDLTIQTGYLDTLGNDLTVTGTFENQNGSQSTGLQLEGGETLTLTMDTDSGLVTYVGSGTYLSLPGGDTYYDLEFAGTGSWKLDAALTVGNSLYMDSGALDAAGYNIDSAGGLESQDTFDLNGGTLTVTAGGSYLDVISGDLNGPVVIDHGGVTGLSASLEATSVTVSSGTLQLEGADITATSLTAESGATIELYGDETLPATIDMQSGSSAIYNGSGTITGLSLGSVYTDLEIDGDTYILDAALVVAGDFSHEGGTFDADGYSIQIGGDVYMGDTFIPGGNTVVLTGTNQEISGSVGTRPFYNLTMEEPGGTLGISGTIDFDVAGRLTLKGASGNELTVAVLPVTGATDLSVGPDTLEYLNISDITVTGSSVDCVQCTDGGGNTNINFTSSSVGGRSGGGGGGGSSSTPSPTVTLSDPVESSVVHGDTVEIIWETTGSDIETVQILFAEDGETYDLVVAQGQVDDGAYSWAIPEIETSQGSLRVEALDASGAVVASDDMEGVLIISSIVVELVPDQPQEVVEEEELPFGVVARMWDRHDELLDMRPGMLFRGEELSGVYYIDRNGARSVFPNEGVFFSYYQGFDDVIFVQDDQLRKLPLGPRITANPTVRPVKFQSDPKVYHVEGGNTLRHIPDEATAESLYGYDWSEKVIEQSPTFYFDYRFAEPLE